MSGSPGDLPEEQIKGLLGRSAEMAADYLLSVERYPVAPDLVPGAVRSRLPASPPEQAEPWEEILGDYQNLIEPALTHWNHPGFLAYFAISGSAPGVAAETLAAALNVNAMLWRTSPAATELEELVCDWLRQMMGLPANLRGHINDTASISTLVALAAAREAAGLDIRQRGMSGRADLPRLLVYSSDQAHSSVDKAAMTLGLGLDGLRRVRSDQQFRLDPAALHDALEQDLRAGYRPCAVVATAGTTSTTSVDPIPEIAELCERYRLWLHVDAAYAGSAALCPELRESLRGIERADSLVVNPHKWLFVPVDCSVLFVRSVEQLRAAFSLVPPYLRTDEAATNLMDLGVQLGRRFRALKLWMVIRSYGVEGLRERIRWHCRLAREFASWVEAEAGWTLEAPLPFSTVCFRAHPPELEGEELDRFNRELVTEVNRRGVVFLSHTELRGRAVVRLAVGNLRTERRHIEAAWAELKDVAASLAHGERSARQAGDGRRP